MDCSQGSPQHGPICAGLSFARFADRFDARSPAEISAAFDELPADKQQACWTDLAAECRRRIEKELFDPILDYVPPPRRARPATRARSAANRRAPTGPHDDPLLEIEPAVYVEVLTGQEVGPSRKVSCPLHEDRTPSLHCYDDPARGWACFGCGQGGRIYQLAALLGGYSLPLRGQDFLAVRDVLLEHFGGHR